MNWLKKLYGFVEKWDLIFGKVFLYYYFLLLKNITVLSKRPFISILVLLCLGGHLFFYFNYFERTRSKTKKIYEEYFNKLTEEYYVLMFIVLISRSIGILDSSDFNKFLIQIAFLFLSPYTLITAYYFSKQEGGFKSLIFISISLSVLISLFFRNYFVNHLILGTILFLILLGIVTLVCSLVKSLIYKLRNKSS